MSDAADLRDQLEALGRRYLELLRLELGGPKPHIVRELAENKTRRAALHEAIAAATRPTGGT